MAKKSDQSVGAKLTPSWDLLGPNYVLISKYYVEVMYLFLLPALVYVLGSELLGQLPVDHKQLFLSQRQLTGLGIMGIAALWTLVNLGPGILFMLRAVDNATTSLRDYYRDGLRLSLRIALFGVVAFVQILGGLLLLVVPGIKMVRRYYLGAYFMVDKNLSVSQTLAECKVSTAPKNVRSAIWGVIGVQLTVTLAATFLGIVPRIGVVIGQLLIYSALFVSVLRYREIKPR